MRLAPIARLVSDRQHHPLQPDRRITAFVNLLRAHNIVAHVREPGGDEINPACRQLRKMVSVAAL